MWIVANADRKLRNCTDIARGLMLLGVKRIAEGSFLPNPCLAGAATCYSGASAICVCRPGCATRPEPPASTPVGSACLIWSPPRLRLVIPVSAC